MLIVRSFVRYKTVINRQRTVVSYCRLSRGTLSYQKIGDGAHLYGVSSESTVHRHKQYR